MPALTHTLWLLWFSLMAAAFVTAAIVGLAWVAGYLSMYRWRRSLKEWWEN